MADDKQMEAERALRNISDAEIAGHMGWRGPGAYTEASLRKIKGIIDHVLRVERATPPSPSTAPEVDELPAPPTLPRYLLDMIGEYGMARTDSVGQLEVQHRWEILIGGIKRYASEYGRALASRPAETSLHAVHDKEPTKSSQRECREIIPAEVDDEGLPPLPKAFVLIDMDDSSIWGQIQDEYWENEQQISLGVDDPLFTAEQFRQGQRDAVAADRAREWVVVGGRRAGRAHMAALARDAARYRWLRESNNVEAISIVDMHSGDSMDARVDQAMAQAAAQRDTK